MHANRKHWRGGGGKSFEDGKCGSAKDQRDHAANNVQRDTEPV